MDLILWRHAEAQEKEPGGDDLQRALTARGEKQAERMGAWLARRLPQDSRVLCSPAKRCVQTVSPLGRKYTLCDPLAPDLDPDLMLKAAGWPDGRHPAVLVGHQPALGQLVSRLLGLQEPDCTIPKGAVWWLRSRERDGLRQVVVVAVQPPDLL